jgi:hypothetical protein
MVGAAGRQSDRDLKGMGESGLTLFLYHNIIGWEPPIFLESPVIYQYTWAKVIARQKTQTRRIVKPNESAIRGRYNKIISVMSGDRTKWRVGGSYAVQTGRGKGQIARVRLTRIRSERLSRIRQADAQAEGFASRQEFLQIWDTIHGPDSREVRVWVLEFELQDEFVKSRFTLPMEQQPSSLANAFPAK